MSIFGSVPNFDCKVDEWPVHKAQIKNFFDANDITDSTDIGGNKRRAILLNCMSQDSYRLTRDLLSPDAPENTTYATIISTLDSHFSPKKCLFAEREKFYAAIKDSQESMTDYAARLRGLAAECNFGPSLDMCLTDRFVLGIDSPVVREKLYREDATQLKMNAALDIACAVEGAQRIACGVGASTVKNEFVLYTAGRGDRRRGSARGGGGTPSAAATEAQAKGPSAERCTVCGARSHAAASCGYRYLACNVCGLIGHLKRMCRNSNVVKTSVSRVNRGGVNNHYVCENEFCDKEDFTPVNNVRCTDEEPMVAGVCILGVELRMEVDSGSAVSVLPAAIWRKYFSNAAQLGKASKTLRTYNGTVVTTVGTCTLPVTYNETIHDLHFYVVENGPVSLLGRDFLTKFNLGFVALNYCSSKESEFLFQKYNFLFSNKLGTFNKYKLSLNLKEGAKPKFCKARPVPFALRDKISDELDRLVRVGILEPVSYSKYASPIVAVLKKNNDVRICGDYSSTINKDLLIDSYPLPTINELCASLNGCRYFSKIDLSNSYNQFLLDEKSQEYTCINTHKGLFKYTRLVFGLANAPALFQRAMVQLLRMEGVEVFLDDVLIAAATPRQHWERVERVLKKLQDAGLMLQKSKCFFFQERIEYLGYIIDSNGIHKNPEKVKAISEARIPENPKQLKSFLGIINFYRSFIPRASMLLEPLHCLLRKDVSWQWTDEHQKAFEAIKKEISSPRVLAHYDPQQQLVLTVDAAPGGLGAVLAVRYSDGRERPLSFASRSLCKSERAYSQIQKEATAIIFGIKKFHQYLYGRQIPFILRTDHKPLMSIFSPDKGISQLTEARLQRYALFLAAYNYKLEFVSSERNVADYLSRFPVNSSFPPNGVSEEVSYVGILSVSKALLPASLDELRSATASDETLAQVSVFVSTGWPKRVTPNLLAYRRCLNELHIDSGLLMRGHRVVIPTVFRKAVLQELHATHLGIIKMKMMARERCWFPGIDTEIENVANSCDRCIEARVSPPKVPIENWNWASTVFERIHIDYLGPIYNKIYLVLVDSYSKWLECVEVPNLTALVLISKLKSIFTRFGLPQCIVSDNATTFRSEELSKFCLEYGIQQIFAPVYSPQSNGLAENAVKTCKKFITNAMKDGCGRDLNARLDEYLFHYRISPHCTTEESPARLMFGRNLRCRLDVISVPSQGAQLTQPPTKTADRVRVKQNRQKVFYRGMKKCFQIGDRVWVRDYRRNPKKPNWVLGSIIAKIGKVLYDVSLSRSDVIWRRHANQLMNANTYNPKPDIIATDTNQWTYDRFEVTPGSNHTTHTQTDTSHNASSSPRNSQTFDIAGGSSGGDAAECFGTPTNDVIEPRVVNVEGDRYHTRSGRVVIPPKRYFD